MFSDSLYNFFDFTSSFPQPWPMIIIGTVCVYFIIMGAAGLYYKKFTVPFTSYMYEGKSSIAPSLTFIFIGSLFPLVFLGTAIDYYFNGQGYGLGAVVFTAAIISIFLIIYVKHKYKPSGLNL